MRSTELDAHIAALFGQGLGQRRIAIAIGRSERVVRDALLRLGLRTPPAEHVAVPAGLAELRERVRELVTSGLTDSQVATAIGVAYERVRNIRRSLGLAPVVDPRRGLGVPGRRVHVTATCLSEAELAAVKVAAGDVPLSQWIRERLLEAAVRGK